MKNAALLNIGGFVRFTTIDYPEHLSAVVFCQGCPWNCHYCYNTHLIPANRPPAMAWEEIIRFLEKRQHCLDAVVFSGGEPTAQPALLPAVQQIKSMGFSVALHTAGAYPRRLKTLLPYLNWVGLDIKAPFATYASITTVPGSGNKAEESLKMLLEHPVPFECRTTVDWNLINEETLKTLATQLQQLGVTQYSVQSCISPFGKGGLEGRLLDDLRAMFPVFVVR